MTSAKTSAMASENCPGPPGRPPPPGAAHLLVDGLLDPYDPYLLLKDFEDYVRCQKEVSRSYRDKKKWLRKSILNVARIGKFSTDRTIREYAEHIWGVKVK